MQIWIKFQRVQFSIFCTGWVSKRHKRCVYGWVSKRHKRCVYGWFIKDKNVCVHTFLGSKRHK